MRSILFENPSPEVASCVMHEVIRAINMGEPVKFWTWGEKDARRDSLRIVATDETADRIEAAAATPKDGTGDVYLFISGEEGAFCRVCEERGFV